MPVFVAIAMLIFGGFQFSSLMYCKKRRDIIIYLATFTAVFTLAVSYAAGVTLLPNIYKILSDLFRETFKLSIQTT